MGTPLSRGQILEMLRTGANGKHPLRPEIKRLVDAAWKEINENTYDVSDVMLEHIIATVLWWEDVAGHVFNAEGQNDEDHCSPR